MTPETIKRKIAEWKVLLKHAGNKATKDMCREKIKEYKEKLKKA